METGRSSAWPRGDGGWSPRGPEGVGGAVVAGAPQVSGGCSEVTRMGPPPARRRWGGRGRRVGQGTPAGGSRWPPSEHLRTLSLCLSSSLPTPRHPAACPGGLQLCTASWGAGGARSGSRGGQESLALQSRRAAQVCPSTGRVGTPRGPRVWRSRRSHLHAAPGTEAGTLAAGRFTSPPPVPPVQPPRPPVPPAGWRPEASKFPALGQVRPRGSSAPAQPWHRGS